MLQYVVNTSTNVFCQYCPRREVLGRATVLSSIRQASWPSPTTTLDRKRTSKERHHVWWVERVFVCFLFSPGLCWSICCTLSQMFSVRTVLDIIRLHVSESPGVSLGSCWSHSGIGYCGDCSKGHCCWEMLQYVLNMSSNVFCQCCGRNLGEKSSDVEQSWAASAKLPGRRPPPHSTGRGPGNEGTMFGELSVSFVFFLFFSFFLLMGCLPVCIGMDVWVNVFRMLFLCVDLTV